MDCLGIQADRCTHHYCIVHCIHKEMDCMGPLQVGVMLNEEYKEELKYIME